MDALCTLKLKSGSPMFPGVAPAPPWQCTFLAPRDVGSRSQEAEPTRSGTEQAQGVQGRAGPGWAATISPFLVSAPFCSFSSFFPVFVALVSPPSHGQPSPQARSSRPVSWIGSLFSWLQLSLPRRGDMSTHVRSGVSSRSSWLHVAGWEALGPLPVPTPVDWGTFQPQWALGSACGQQYGWTAFARSPAVADGPAQGAEGQGSFRVSSPPLHGLDGPLCPAST